MDRMATGGTRIPKPQSGRVPWYVPFINPIVRPLLATGIPMGFNGLITIRGRNSGLPRATPVAIIEVSGRRWVWGPLGRGPLGAQPAGRRPRDHRPAPPAGRGPCDRAGPHRTRRVLSGRPGSAGAQHPVRCHVHSHRRWCRSQRSGGRGRGSTCLRTPPTSMKAFLERLATARGMQPHGWPKGTHRDCVRATVPLPHHEPKPSRSYGVTQAQTRTARTSRRVAQGYDCPPAEGDANGA